MKTDFTGLAYLAALAVGGIAVYYVWKQGSAAAGAVGDAISGAVSSAGNAIGTVVQAVNPTNANNVFASSVNKAGSLLTGQTDFSLGAWYYDLGVKVGALPDAGAIATAPSMAKGVNQSDRISLGATGTW